MRKIDTFIAVFILLFSLNAKGGNEDRAGEAGASELLINPWVRSSGWGGANSASIQGLEAMNFNVAGLAYTSNTEVIGGFTSWLGDADIDIFTAGVAQKVGETGVLGISVMSMDFGEIEVTTADLPDGGIGTFDPNFLNIGVGYSKRFSNSISGGFVIRFISESTADLNASGIALDAGVNYVTGDNDAFKFGISLRNIGPTMEFDGNGLSLRSDIPNSDKTLTLEQRSEDFELPSLVNIGASYNFYLSDVEEKEGGEYYSTHRITASGTFTSNSFTKDQVRVGAEYAFQEMFMVRGGFVFESDTGDDEAAATTSEGPTFGATIEVPMGKSGSTFGVDYSYRATRVFSGSHAIGLRLTF